MAFGTQFTKHRVRRATVKRLAPGSTRVRCFCTITTAGHERGTCLGPWILWGSYKRDALYSCRREFFGGEYILLENARDNQHTGELGYADYGNVADKFAAKKKESCFIYRSPYDVRINALNLSFYHPIILHNVRVRLNGSNNRQKKRFRAIVFIKNFSMRFRAENPILLSPKHIFMHIKKK